jgi:hypothetical protein
MKKHKLDLERETLRNLERRELDKLKGGLPADDGTNSGYKVCLSYYCGSGPTWPCC